MWITRGQGAAALAPDDEELDDVELEPDEADEELPFDEDEDEEDADDVVDGDEDDVEAPSPLDFDSELAAPADAFLSSLLSALLSLR